jgi:hypothetical protein
MTHREATGSKIKRDKLRVRFHQDLPMYSRLNNNHVMPVPAIPKNSVLPQNTFCEKSIAPASRIPANSHQAIHNKKNVRGTAPGAGRRIQTIQATNNASIEPIKNANENGGKLNAIANIENTIILHHYVFYV